MRRGATVLLSALLVTGGVTARAQTLDELQHPLLEKGKGVVAADYDTYAIEHEGWQWIAVKTSPFESRFAVLPAFSVGLARTVQVTVNGSYQLPTNFADAAPGYYSSRRALVRSVSGTLLFRLRSNLEFGATALYGQAALTSDYERTRNVAALSIEPFRTTVVSLRGTWLTSTPLQDAAPTIRANLDGFLHPLLKAGRWKIDWEAMARWYRHDKNDSDVAGLASAVERAASRDFRLRLGVARGVTDRLQVGADGYWHPPFEMTQDGQMGGKLLGNQAGNFSWPRWFDRVLGARLQGRWRPGSTLEAFAAGAWEHQAVSYINDPSSGALRHDSTTVKAGGTWLSRLPRTSQALTPDISGLYHPILEPKQLQIDAFAWLQRHRADQAYLNTDSRVYRLQATLGIARSLQVGGYAGATSFRDNLSDEGFNTSPAYGAVLRVLAARGAEVFGTVEKHRDGWLLDDYPMFVLASGDDFAFGRSVDFLQPHFDGTYTVHVGIRFLF